MPQPTPKTAVLVLTSPRALTDAQRTAIADSVRSELPADVGVIILDAGFTASIIELAS